MFVFKVGNHLSRENSPGDIHTVCVFSDGFSASELLASEFLCRLLFHRSVIVRSATRLPLLSGTRAGVHMPVNGYLTLVEHVTMLEGLRAQSCPVFCSVEKKCFCCCLIVAPTY